MRTAGMWQDVLKMDRKLQCRGGTASRFGRAEDAEDSLGQMDKIRIEIGSTAQVETMGDE